jgi:hypothetical protein
MKISINITTTWKPIPIHYQSHTTIYKHYETKKMVGFRITRHLRDITG